MKLRVVGFDPSLRNWGVSVGSYDTETSKLSILDLKVISPVLAEHKRVRQNSLDLESAQQLFAAASLLGHNANAVFVEVPHGSQSSRAMASYGICVGVLGALRHNAITFLELNASEVKLASFGCSKATKQEMIDWAVRQHPEAPWPMVKEKGVARISAAKAEHMADATAAIHAGIRSQQFQQSLSLLRPAHP